ncbi:MAG: Hsp20/alpha crystallin family protein [Myxococcota bacterium]
MVPFFGNGLVPHPFGLMDDFRNLLDASAAPTLDAAPVIEETDDAITVRFDVPGVTPENVNVEVRDGILSVDAHRTVDAPEGYRSLRSERGSFRIKRRIRLNDRLDPDRAEADLDMGVLTIRLGKRPEAQPRSIPVHAR